MIRVCAGCAVCLAQMARGRACGAGEGVLQGLAALLRLIQPTLPSPHPRVHVPTPCAQQLGSRVHQKTPSHKGSLPGELPGGLHFPFCHPRNASTRKCRDSGDPAWTSWGRNRLSFCRSRNQGLGAACVPREWWPLERLWGLCYGGERDLSATHCVSRHLPCLGQPWFCLISPH